jgi:hypothetical protein
MQDTGATSTQIAERAAKPRRRGPSRLQTVGDYAGQLAGEAAQAVRRAGLKPGLERSFGFAPELRGQIVAQEPQSGSELARNGLVTLYVAAPGSAPPGEQAAAGPAASEHSDVEVSARRLADAEPASDRAGTAPRRKKSRHPSGARGPAFDAPPPPSLPNVEETAEALSLDAPDHGEVEGDRATEEHVIEADELFAGRASVPAWRRVYPRRHRGFRPRLGGRPRLMMAALALLAVWLIVALAAALIGHRASPQGPNAGQEHAGVPAQTPSLASVPARPRPSEHRAPTPQRHAARHRQRSTAPKRRRARRAPARHPAQQATHAVTTPAAPTPTAAAPASRAPAPVQRDAEGGLFSP